MSSRELSEWMAYARVEPFGQTRENWHMATLASLIYAANRGEDGKELGPQDFMWKITPTKEQQRRIDRRKQKEMWQQLLGWAKGNQPTNGNH